MAQNPRPTTPAVADRASTPDGSAVPTVDGVDDLVEDVSIDGMCGVY